MGRKRRRKKTDKAPPAKAPATPTKRPWVLIGGLALLVGVGAWAAWSTLGAWGTYERKPLNIILITADTLRADRLSCYGSSRVATPNLDRLAASGVLFEHTTTVTPLTLPAHSSMFTGTYPMYHGVRDNGGYYLEPEHVTLAEILKGEGYNTGAFVAAFVLDSRWGLDQGFDRYYDDFDLSKFETVSLDSVQRRGDEVLAEALPWMDSVRDERFLSWIHLYDPHTPYDPPEPYLSQYEGVPWGRYDGEVAYLDSLVGQIMEWLTENDLNESTLVAFIGDHGESLGEHREMGHGFFIYDATVAVPFILTSPDRQLQGRRVAAQVRTIDLMPTLLDLIGVEIPEAVQGESLLDLCLGKSKDLGLMAYSESLYPRHHYGWSDLKSLRDGSLQYIAAPRPELYDIRADPSQKDNLASSRPDEVRDFERQLQELIDRYSAQGIEEKGPEMLDPETQAQLAALGYLGGPSKVNVDPSAQLSDPKDKIELFNLIKQAGSDSSEDRLDEALDKIRQVLSKDSDILEAHHILGNLLNKKDDTEAAIEAYQEALARDPEYKPALFSLASIYEESGRLEDGAAGFRRILDIDPRDNTASFRLATIHASRKEYEPAIEILSNSIDMGVERAPAHNLMAECYIGLEKYDEAEAAVRKALDMKDDLPTAYYNLALILEERGDLRGAAEAYEKEIAIAPGDFKAHFNLAKIFGQIGRLEKQMEHFEKSIEVNEEFAVGYLYLSKMYLDRGDLEKASSLAKKGIELGPEPSMAPLGHYILADVYNRMGRLEDAEREVAIARRLESSGS
jgi:arylsulfatase A-like enzyme/tetratricopeptide (TPR) repeat protein